MWEVVCTLLALLPSGWTVIDLSLPDQIIRAKRPEMSRLQKLKVFLTKSWSFNSVGQCILMAVHLLVTVILKLIVYMIGNFPFTKSTRPSSQRRTSQRQVGLLQKLDASLINLWSFGPILQCTQIAAQYLATTVFKFIGKIIWDFPITRATRPRFVHSRTPQHKVGMLQKIDVFLENPFGINTREATKFVFVPKTRVSSLERFCVSLGYLPARNFARSESAIIEQTTKNTGSEAAANVDQDTLGNVIMAFVNQETFKVSETDEDEDEDVYEDACELFDEVVMSQKVTAQDAGELKDMEEGATEMNPLPELTDDDTGSSGNTSDIGDLGDEGDKDGKAFEIELSENSDSDVVVETSTCSQSEFQTITHEAAQTIEATETKFEVANIKQEAAQTDGATTEVNNKVIPDENTTHTNDVTAEVTNEFVIVQEATHINEKTSNEAIVIDEQAAIVVVIDEEAANAVVIDDEAAKILVIDEECAHPNNEVETKDEVLVIDEEATDINYQTAESKDKVLVIINEDVVHSIDEVHQTNNEVKTTQLFTTCDTINDAPPLIKTNQKVRIYTKNEFSKLPETGCFIWADEPMIACGQPDTRDWTDPQHCKTPEANTKQVPIAIRETGVFVWSDEPDIPYWVEDTRDWEAPEHCQKETVIITCDTVDDENHHDNTANVAAQHVLTSESLAHLLKRDEFKWEDEEFDDDVPQENILTSEALAHLLKRDEFKWEDEEFDDDVPQETLNAPPVASHQGLRSFGLETIVEEDEEEIINQAPQNHDHQNVIQHDEQSASGGNDNDMGTQGLQEVKLADGIVKNLKDVPIRKLPKKEQKFTFPQLPPTCVGDKFWCNTRLLLFNAGVRSHNGFVPAYDLEYSFLQGNLHLHGVRLLDLYRPKQVKDQNEEWRSKKYSDCDGVWVSKTDEIMFAGTCRAWKRDQAYWRAVSYEDDDDDGVSFI